MIVVLVSSFGKSIASAKLILNASSSEAGASKEYFVITRFSGFVE